MQSTQKDDWTSPFLRDIEKYPSSSLQARYTRLGMSPSKGQSVRNTLRKIGLISEAKQGTYTRVRLTRRGMALLHNEMSTKKRIPQGDLSSALLDDIRRHPFTPWQDRFKRLGLSQSKGHEVQAGLRRNILIIESNQGKNVYVGLTEAGKAFLNRNTRQTQTTKPSRTDEAVQVQPKRKTQATKPSGPSYEDFVQLAQIMPTKILCGFLTVLDPDVRPAEEDPGKEIQLTLFHQAACAEFSLRQIEPLSRKLKRFAIRNGPMAKKVGEVAAYLGLGALLGGSIWG